MSSLNSLLLKGYDVKFSSKDYDTLLIEVSRIGEDKKYRQEKVLLTTDLIREARLDPVDECLRNLYLKLEHPFYYPWNNPPTP